VALACATSSLIGGLRLFGFCSAETAYEVHAPKGHRHVAGGDNPRTRCELSGSSAPKGRHFDGVHGLPMLLTDTPRREIRSRWSRPPFRCRPSGAGVNGRGRCGPGVHTPGYLLGPLRGRTHSSLNSTSSRVDHRSVFQRSPVRNKICIKRTPLNRSMLRRPGMAPSKAAVLPRDFSSTALEDRRTAFRENFTENVT
jgi:hypothetical protein